jgi:hypothetical protein
MILKHGSRFSPKEITAQSDRPCCGDLRKWIRKNFVASVGRFPIEVLEVVKTEWELLSLRMIRLSAMLQELRHC